VRWAVLAAIASAGCARHAGELELVDVRRDDLVVTVDVAGQLEAVDSTDVKPPALPETSNLKISWLAPEGSEVVAGAPVVIFESSELDRMLESLHSQADEWNTRAEQMREAATLARRAGELAIVEQEAGVQRATILASAPPDLVAQLTLRGHQLDEQQAKAELAQARKKTAYDRRAQDAQIQSLVDVHAGITRQITQLEHSITQLSVAAPRAGTVIYATNYAGEKPKVGATPFASDIVVQVVALGAMRGNGHADEVDIARLAVHAPVTLRVEAFPDVRLRGTVASIAPSVQTSDTDPSHIVRLQVAIEPTTGCALRPGMRFRGQLEHQRIPNVIQVPVEAVFLTPEGPVAYRETAGGAERVRVALGRRSTEAIEVTSGLVPGDRVSRVNPEQEAP
jgi:HlyD family secretion protein